MAKRTNFKSARHRVMPNVKHQAVFVIAGGVLLFSRSPFLSLTFLSVCMCVCVCECRGGRGVIDACLLHPRLLQSPHQCNKHLSRFKVVVMPHESANEQLLRGTNTRPLRYLSHTSSRRGCSVCVCVVVCVCMSAFLCKLISSWMKSQMYLIHFFYSITCMIQYTYFFSA